MANPVQYIILHKPLGMSTGKAAAQAAHASQMGILTHRDVDKGRTNPYDDSMVNLWMRGGHYAKVVLQTDTDLPTVERYLNDRGFKTALIIDEGRTEVDGLTPTAIGTGVIDKDWPHTRATFGAFDLYTTSTADKDNELVEYAKAIKDSDHYSISSELRAAAKTVLSNPSDIGRRKLTNGSRPAATKDPAIKAMFRRVREALGEDHLDEKPKPVRDSPMQGET